MNKLVDKYGVFIIDKTGKEYNPDYYNEVYSNIE